MAYVSALNDCRYCSSSHSAGAAAQLPGGMEVVEQVRADAGSASISAKLKALLVIASAARQSGLQVSADEVAEARAADATDLEIHDTVLIAAAFCMFNRYVQRAGHERAARSRALRSRSTAPDQGRIPAAGKAHPRKLTQPSSPRPSTPAIFATPAHQARPARGRQEPTYAGGTAASCPRSSSQHPNPRPRRHPWGPLAARLGLPCRLTGTDASSAVPCALAPTGAGYGVSPGSWPGFARIAESVRADRRRMGVSEPLVMSLLGRATERLASYGLARSEPGACSQPSAARPLRARATAVVSPPIRPPMMAIFGLTLISAHDRRGQACLHAGGRRRVPPVLPDRTGWRRPMRPGK